MKKCSGCQKKKDYSEFNYKDKKRGTLQTRCKECTRKQVRNHYYANKKYYIRKARIRNKEISIYLRDYVYNYLSSHPCVDCGETDITVLEFDHIQNKTNSISNLLRNRVKLKVIFKEVAKCEVRCANCHRRKTAKQIGWYKLVNKAPIAQ